MLKKSAIGILTSLRGSTCRTAPSDSGITDGNFPFAKIHVKGERVARAAACAVSPLCSLRLCWTVFLNSLRAIQLPSVISDVVSFPVL